MIIENNTKLYDENGEYVGTVKEIITAYNEILDNYLKSDEYKVFINSELDKMFKDEFEKLFEEFES